MNRFKKEIRKRGFQLESDMECVPSDGGIEMVIADADDAVYCQYHVSAGWTSWWFGRDLNVALIMDHFPNERLADKYCLY